MEDVVKSRKVAIPSNRMDGSDLNKTLDNMIERANGVWRNEP